MSDVGKHSLANWSPGTPMTVMRDLILWRGTCTLVRLERELVRHASYPMPTLLHSYSCEITLGRGFAGPARSRRRVEVRFRRNGCQPGRRVAAPSRPPGRPPVATVHSRRE